MINTDAGLMFYWRRQYDQAINQFRKTIDLDPNFWGEHLYLGMAYDKKGAYADAQAEFQRAKTLSEGSAVTLAAFGHLYAMLGKKSDALKVLDDLKELSKNHYVSSYYLAIIYAGLGQKDQAFEELDKTYMEHSDYLVYLNVEPLLDGLRSDPRFVTLMRRVSLTP